MIGEYAAAIFISGVTVVDPSPPVVARRSPLSVAPPFSSSSASLASDSVGFSDEEDELVFAVLQRLDPGERKLPKVMEPWGLMNGVARCCWLE